MTWFKLLLPGLFLLPLACGFMPLSSNPNPISGCWFTPVGAATARLNFTTLQNGLYQVEGTLNGSPPINFKAQARHIGDREVEFVYLGEDKNPMGLPLRSRFRLEGSTLTLEPFEADKRGTNYNRCP